MQNISTINKNKHNLISVYTTFSAIFLLSRDEKISAKNKQKKKNNNKKSSGASVEMDLCMGLLHTIRPTKPKQKQL